MKTLGLILVALIGTALITAAAPEGLTTSYKKALPAAAAGQPAIEVLHTMKSVAREVVLDIVFADGLHRRKGRGTTSGVYIEVNDAEQPTHPVRNPFAPLPVDRRHNREWKDFVSREFPYPNPEPGYWYTWGKQRQPLKRPIKLRFAHAGRYRIRVRGVLPPDGQGPHTPTLMRVIEVGHGILAPHLPVGWQRAERALPTGERETSSLLIQRDAPKTVAVGETFEYIVRVRNISTRKISNVSLVERGAEGVAILKSSAAMQVESPGVCSWAIGALEAGATREVKLSARIDTEGAPERHLHARWLSAPATQKITAK